MEIIRIKSKNAYGFIRIFSFCLFLSLVEENRRKMGQIGKSRKNNKKQENAGMKSEWKDGSRASRLER